MNLPGFVLLSIITVIFSTAFMIAVRDSIKQEPTTWVNVIAVAITAVGTVISMTALSNYYLY